MFSVDIENYFVLISKKFSSKNELKLDDEFPFCLSLKKDEFKSDKDYYISKDLAISKKDFEKIRPKDICIVELDLDVKIQNIRVFKIIKNIFLIP